LIPSVERFDAQYRELNSRFAVLKGTKRKKRTREQAGAQLDEVGIGRERMKWKADTQTRERNFIEAK
jgi:hypothetical protein